MGEKEPQAEKDAEALAKLLKKRRERPKEEVRPPG